MDNKKITIKDKATEIVKSLEGWSQKELQDLGYAVITVAGDMCIVPLADVKRQSTNE